MRRMMNLNKRKLKKKMWESSIIYFMKRMKLKVQKTNKQLICLKISRESKKNY